MPKEARNTMLKRLVKEFNKMGNNYSTDEEIILCNSCEKPIVVKKRCDVTQHSNSATHRQNLRKLKEKANSGQQLISQSSNKASSQTEKQRNFNKKLCKTLVESYIPLYKMIHSSIISFFQEFTAYEHLMNQL